MRLEQQEIRHVCICVYVFWNMEILEDLDF